MPVEKSHRPPTKIGQKQQIEKNKKVCKLSKIYKRACSRRTFWKCLLTQFDMF